MTSTAFRNALHELGISQAEFSRRSGKAVTTVNRWATGTAPIPAWVAWVVVLLEGRQRAVQLLTLDEAA